jgi:hypothetical protein
MTLTAPGRGSGPRRLPVARQHPDDEDRCARADEEGSRRRAEAGTEQARHGEHENDSDDEIEKAMETRVQKIHELIIARAVRAWRRARASP